MRLISCLPPPKGEKFGVGVIIQLVFKPNTDEDEHFRKLTIQYDVHLLLLPNISVSGTHKYYLIAACCVDL